MDELEESLELYRVEKIPFRELVRRTNPHWTRIAKMILSRWRAPSFAPVEDLVQEMLITLPESVREWDPQHGSGVTLRSFVTFRAHDRARKWLHIQRRAGHAGGKGPSRFDMPFSALVAPGDDDAAITNLVERMAPATIARQEQELLRSETLYKLGPLRTALSVYERTEDFDLVVHEIMTNQAAREALGVKKIDECKREARRMIEVFAESVQL